MFSLLSSAGVSGIAGSLNKLGMAGANEQAATPPPPRQNSILSLNRHPISLPAGGSVKRDIALDGDFLSSWAGGAAAVPHRPPMQKPGVG